MYLFETGGFVCVLIVCGKRLFVETGVFCLLSSVIYTAEETRFGRTDSVIQQDVFLAGLSIRKEHGIMVNTGSKFLIRPVGDAKVCLMSIVRCLVMH